MDLEAEIAIVGGGVLGASIAWQLTERGVDRVVVVERHSIGTGSSSLAAGLVSHVRGSADLLSMVRATVHDIDTLESRLAGSIGFRRSGSLRIADHAETGASLGRVKDMLNGNGVDAFFVDAVQAADRVPWLDASGAHSILFIPEDGFVDGQGLAMAYASAARAGGATILNGTAAIAPRYEGGRLAGIETTGGRIRFKTLINAAGPWAGQMLGWFDRALEAAPLRSHYWITAPSRPAWPSHPVVVLADAHAYLRPEVGGLLIGIQERVSRSYDARTLPADLSELALTGPNDWDLLAGHAPRIRKYLPVFDDLAFKRHIAGITTYTPDGHFLVGPVAGIENLIVVSGCCGTGVSCAGGISRLACDLALGQPPGVTPESFAPGRFAGADPYSEQFVSQCIASRADKSRR